MKVASLTIRNAMGKGPTISLPLIPTSSTAWPYYVTDITGLDPEGIQYRQVGSALSNNATYLPRVETLLRNRQVAVKVRLNPYVTGLTNNSFGALRDNLYRVIAAAEIAAVDLIFTPDGEDPEPVKVTGTIQGIEINRFSFEQTAVITINFPDDSLFRGTVVKDVTIANPVNSSLTFSDDESTAPHGAGIGLVVNAVPPSGNWMQIMNTLYIDPSAIPGGVDVGDQIHVANLYSQRQISIVKSGISSEIAQALTSIAVWPVVYPGSNTWATSPWFNWLYVKYFTAYWGI
jgi:hypothetical protein